MTHPLGNWAENARAIRYNARNPQIITEIRECLAPLKLDENDRFVDFGSGEGLHLLEAASRVEEAVGIDISPFQMAQAQRRLRHVGNVTLIEADFSDLMLDTYHFTKGFSRRALHHLNDEEKASFFANIGPSFATGALFLLEDVIRFPGWQAALVDFREGRSDPKLKVPDCILQDIGEEFPADAETLDGALAHGGFRVLSCEQGSPFYGRILSQRAIPVPSP